MMWKDGKMDEIATKLRDYKICTACLGRLFDDDPATVLETGNEVKAKLGLETSEDSCDLCGGFLLNMGKLVENAFSALEGFEFDNFHLGFQIPRDIIELEDEIRSELKLSSGLSLKKYASAILTKEIAERTGKAPDNSSPDVLILFSIDGSVKVDPLPIFVEGRYVKHEGMMSALTAGWRPIATVHSDGVQSVEQMVGMALKEIFDATGIVISWTGTDDVGVTVDGKGRVFYAKIIGARRRKTWVIRSMNRRWSSVNLPLIDIVHRSDVKVGLAKRYYDVVEVEAELDDGMGQNDVRILEESLKDVMIRLRKVEGDIARDRVRRVAGFRVIARSGSTIAARLCAEHGFDLRKLFSCEDVERYSRERADPSLKTMIARTCRKSRYRVLDVLDECDSSFV